MKKQTFNGRDIPMREEVNAEVDDVPVVARSPSYQQPYQEAEEMTRYAMEQRKVKRG